MGWRPKCSWALALYLYLLISGGRRFYQCSWLGSTWRAVVLFTGFFALLNVYRLLLFLLTAWQVSYALK